MIAEIIKDEILSCLEGVPVNKRTSNAVKKAIKAGFATAAIEPDVEIDNDNMTITINISNEPEIRLAVEYTLRLHGASQR